MEYTIHVEQFGKIKKADIRVAPLTLFVGDNNSGKSYLLSLVWAFQTWDMHSLMFRGMENIEEYGESAVPCFHHLLKHQSRREMLSA